MADRIARAGDTVDIPGLGNRTRQPDCVRYDYASGKCLCPICGGLGIPWAGWFTCETRDCCVALIETGEVFTPGIGVAGPDA